MTASVWDDPDLKFVDEFVKLENVGDGFRGRITHIRSHRFDDGSVAAQITFVDSADNVEKTWSAGQVQAKRKLAEIRPEVGWWIKVQLTQIEKRGNKTLKHLDIDCRPGTGVAPQPAAAPPPAAAPAAEWATAAIPATPPPSTGLPCPSAIDPAKWAQMNPAQRAQMYEALGLPSGSTYQTPVGAGAFTDEPPF